MKILVKVSEAEFERFLDHLSIVSVQTQPNGVKDYVVHHNTDREQHVATSYIVRNANGWYDQNTPDTTVYCVVVVVD